ncbi:MAG: copper homeostasis protein CutC [bacterium]
MSFELEVISFDLLSCKVAQEHGADRIELCANPHEGGTTPSYGMIKAARNITSIQLFPIIRPRGGDFLYTEDEFFAMQEDIKVCREIGCDGVVIGMLNADGTIDMKRCADLKKAAGGMQVTFHRAFDRVNDPFAALEQIIDLGCHRILTSGLKPTATEGVDLLRKLVEQAKGRIKIMPGSGVRSDNIQTLAEKTGARAFHSSARHNVPSSMQFLNRGMNEDLEQVSLNGNEVRAIRENLNEYIESNK